MMGRIGIVVGCGLCLAWSGYADLMPANPSFEMPPLLPGGNDQGQTFHNCPTVIGCWGADFSGMSGPAGIYYPTTAQYMPSPFYNGSPSLVPDGNQAAFDLHNGIVQEVSATLQAGAVYNFSAWIGAPLKLYDNSGANGSAVFDIRIADGLGGPILLDLPGSTGTAGTNPIPFGSWRQMSKSFTVPMGAPPGGPVISLSGGADTAEVDFDAIDLSLACGTGGCGSIVNEFVPPPNASSGFTMILAGDVRNVLNSNELLRLSADRFANPWAYLGRSAAVTTSLDNNGNTVVQFTGTFAISNADFFCAGGPPCNGLPHFGLDSTEVSSLKIIDQYWTDEPFRHVASLTLDGPQVNGQAEDWATLFADVTTGGDTAGQWFEVPYTAGTDPLLKFTNNTGAAETLSNVGFLLSPTEIPLDALSFGMMPPPGQPGSPFTDLKEFDGLTLPSGGSVSFTATPEPSTLALSGLILASCVSFVSIKKLAGKLGSRYRVPLPRRWCSRALMPTEGMRIFMSCVNRPRQ